VAALAQNGDGLRANQAGPADDDNLHGLPPLSTMQKQNAATRKIIRVCVGTGKACGRFNA
jgi:hypothetical protein